jgi:hypothetical protein
MRRPLAEKRQRISRQPTAPQPVLELPLVAPRADEELDHRRRRPEEPKSERGIAIVDFYL